MSTLNIQEIAGMQLNAKPLPVEDSAIALKDDAEIQPSGIFPFIFIFYASAYLF